MPLRCQFWALGVFGKKVCAARFTEHVPSLDPHTAMGQVAPGLTVCSCRQGARERAVYLWPPAGILESVLRPFPWTPRSILLLPRGSRSRNGAWILWSTQLGIFFSQSGGWKPRIQGPADGVPARAPPWPARSCPSRVLTRRGGQGALRCSF